MRRVAQFLVTLVLGLALLTVGGYAVMTRLMATWFDRDLRLRGQLAVSAAERGLVNQWADAQRLTERLIDITRDERVMAAAACASDGTQLAATPGYAPALACPMIAARFHAEARDGAWALSAELPTGEVLVSATAVAAGDAPLGFVLLVQDLSFVDRREAATRDLLIGMFFVLLVGGSLVTLVAARMAWRGWNRQLHRALDGDGPAAFQSLGREVWSWVDRRARKIEPRGGRWSPARLRATLKQHLQGERIVVLANREPYIHERTDDGIVVRHPASGLVTALEPVMRACSGVWVAHGAGSADRETVDARDHVRVPPGEESYLVRRVWLSEAEEGGYYYGLANEGLWPLCHVADARPVFRAEDWAQYVAVNRRFADAVCEEVDSDDPIVLVQDYHFALAPKMIRERLPRATILTFWHIPWPNAERIGICPWREELIAGLLGSSILGFHTQQHCNSFIDSVDAFVESRIDREAHAVIQRARRTLVRPYPISIEWPVHWLAQVPPVEVCRATVRAELGLPADRLLGVGVDRLDYTKGIEERLLAVDALLTQHPEFRGRFTFIQLAAPSRTKIERYRELNDRIEALTAELNAKWGVGDYQPIVLLRAHHEPNAVFRFFRAAELCYVSSLHDGMNLVAKEFVAARDDERGVLVLSQFTGAARDLPEALLVNPYDLREASAALAAALTMPAAEQHERMQSMRVAVAEFNVYRWAGRMIIDAAELRRRNRMTGRMSSTDLAIRASR